MFRPSLTDVVTFLTHLFNSGLGYSSLNTARCALSSIIMRDSDNTIGNHPLVSRFIKGVYHLRPPSCRYDNIWDVSIVLRYLRGLHPLSSLSMKMLTLKLVTLVALVSAQRLQTLQLLDISTVHGDGSTFVFTIPDQIKQSRPGSGPIKVVLRDFQEDQSISVVKVLEFYLKQTKNLRGSCSKLFISYVKPHAAVSRDTLARWIKLVLDLSGVDTKTFSAHSTRAASTSAAYSRSVPIEEILKVAGWKSEKTFAKFYNKEVLHQNETFTNILLS